MRDGFREALEILERLDTRTSRTAKTARTVDKHSRRREKPNASKSRTANTAKTSEAERLGLVATWAAEFGYVAIHDPTTGEWHDLRTKDAPKWAVGEARRRKDLYRDGNRRAYRLTSREMEELWKAANQVEEGIVEDHPLEVD